MSAGNRPSLNKPATWRQARSNTNDSEFWLVVTIIIAQAWSGINGSK